MFTIRDNLGNPVGFSGRKYDDSDAPKYINTKETDIFKKVIFYLIIIGLKMRLEEKRDYY